MQNPFTTTFSKTPEYTYIHTEKTEEILENFIYDNPSESVYKITGVRGSGKTVILAKVEEELRTNESRYINWLVFDVNPARDILGQIAAMLVKAGFGSQDKKTTGINLSATVMGTGGGIGYTAENNNNFFDIGVEVETMIQAAQKKGKKILIGIDEVSKSEEMIKFASEYGRWLRAGYPVYFVCTGLYENIQELSNVKNLTFFRRAATVKTEPLRVSWILTVMRLVKWRKLQKDTHMHFRNWACCILRRKRMSHWKIFYQDSRLNCLHILMKKYGKR